MSNLWHCNSMLLSAHMLDHISSYSWMHAAYGHKVGFTQLSLIYSNCLPLFGGTSFIFSVEWNDSLGIVRIIDCDTRVLKCWVPHARALNILLEFIQEYHGDTEFQGSLVQPPVPTLLFLLLVCSETSPPRCELLSIFVLLGRTSMPSSSNTARLWAGSLP